MARIVKEEEYAARRREILNAAQKLIYTKGYEQMSIQEILDSLKISKGAFYHYFDSKQDLLEELVERMMEEGMQLILPFVEDPDATALEKFRNYFDTAVAWKMERKEYLLALVRGWYSDNNALLRQKMFTLLIQRVTPLFTTIIEQGIREGVFTPSHPDGVGAVVLSLFQVFGDNLTQSILALEHELDEGRRQEGLRQIETSIAAYTEALERVLGAPPGSLKIIEPEAIREWVLPKESVIPGSANRR